MSQYSKVEYWEDRYTKDLEPFDWYQKYVNLKEIMKKFVNNSSRILNVGAGNSRLSEEMFSDGYTNITNVDFSNTVCKAMQEKYKQVGPNFKFIQMDVRSMEFDDETFDLVVDKGTLDSVVSGENCNTNIQKMLAEVSRTLDQNGTYFCVSYGQPDHRLIYLEKPEYGWRVQVFTVQKPSISTSISHAAEDKDSPNVHYVYVCKKGNQSK